MLVFLIHTSSNGQTTSSVASHCEDVELVSPRVQYCLTATSIFSGTRGPSSWSINLRFHLMPPIIFLTLISTSTLSLRMTAPSGRKIRSISKRMSSNSHLYNKKAVNTSWHYYFNKNAITNNSIWNHICKKEKWQWISRTKTSANTSNISRYTILDLEMVTTLKF